MFGIRDWLYKRYVARRNAQFGERVRQFEASGELKSLTYEETAEAWRLDVLMKHENIVHLAEDAGDFLEENKAANFVQFTMFSAKHSRPVLVTVQWADGESPGDKLARLEKELAELKGAA